MVGTSITARPMGRARNGWRRRRPIRFGQDEPGDEEGSGDAGEAGGADEDGDAEAEAEAPGAAGEPEGGFDPDGTAEGDGALDGDAGAEGDGEASGTGVASGSTPGANSTIPARTPAPTATPTTRPAATANLPPIAAERTSTTRSEARAPTVVYHSAAMSGLPSSALSALRTRLVPALLTALGVLLITAGLLSYADPTTAGTVAEASPTAVDLSPGPSSSGDLPSSGASDAPSGTPDPTKTPGPAHVTRVVVPALKIDLPVVPGPDGYPYCNVAMYIDGLGKPLQDLGQPGRGIATYLYAHARDGMFGPIYEDAIEKHKPDKLLGMIVQVYTSDNKLYLYEVRKVLLHQLTLDSAFAADSEQLWLQTSEGPKGTPGKTQLKAALLSVGEADPGDAHPKAKPVTCS
jgi:hypothetical protein